MAARVIAAMTSSREYKDVIWVVGRFIRVPPRLASTPEKTAGTA